MFKRSLLLFPSRESRCIGYEMIPNISLAVLIYFCFIVFVDRNNPFNNYTSNTNEDFSEPSAPDEWDIEPPPIEDAGVPVRALYDFQGVEDDELNFKEGDILTQLSSQDDQGWCQGRFQGKIGHFPGSYVEPL